MYQSREVPCSEVVTLMAKKERNLRTQRKWHEQFEVTDSVKERILTLEQMFSKTDEDIANAF